MTALKKAEEIARRMEKYGMKPDDEFPSLYDALVAMLDAVDAECDRLREALEEMLAVYEREVDRDNISARARAALKEVGNE